MKRLSTIALLILAPWPLFAAPQRLVLDPKQSEVTFELDATGHDVHGVVTLESGEVVFDLETGEASGAIVLDAAHAVTGNSSRDRTMRGEVLEVAKFPTIEFMPAKVSGELAEDGSSSITLHGVIRLHGDPHPLALPANVQLNQGHLKAEARFEIPYQDWGMHDPSVLFLRVARVVAVTVRAEGELLPATGDVVGEKR